MKEAYYSSTLKVGIYKVKCIQQISGGIDCSAPQFNEPSCGGIIAPPTEALKSSARSTDGNRILLPEPAMHTRCHLWQNNIFFNKF